MDQSVLPAWPIGRRRRPQDGRVLSSRNVAASGKTASVLLAFLLLMLAAGRASAALQLSYSRNRFKTSDALAVYVQKNATLCRSSRSDATPASACLQKASLWSFEAPLAKVNQSAINLPCTLPPVPDIGIAQLTLSGDGRFLTLPCYLHPPGTNASTATDFAIAVIFPDGSVDVSTVVRMPAGKRIYSAVSDNGTAVWIASDLGLHFAPLGSNLQDQLFTVDGSSAVSALTLPVRHVTIQNGTELWLSSGNDVLTARKGSSGGVPAFFSGSDHPTDFDALPRLGASGGDTLYLDRVITMLRPNSGSFVAGFAPTVLSRGPPFFPFVPSINVTVDNEQRYTNSSAPLLHQEARLILGRPVFAGSSVDVFLYNAGSSSSPSSFNWTKETIAGEPSIQIGASVLHVSAVHTRYRPHRFAFIGDLKGNYTCNALGTLYATTPNGVYNHTLIDGRQFGVKTQPTQLMVGNLLRWQEHLGMFLGVSIAPFDAALPLSLPTPTPSPSVSPTANAFPSQASTPSATPPAPSMTPSNAPPLYFEYGVQMGPRIGKDAFTGLSTMLLGLTRVGSPNGTDFRTPGVEHQPQPVFLDIIRQDTGKVVASLPMPTKRNGVHAACTSSFSSYHMWPKVAASENQAFSSLTCYDAEVNELLPNSYYPPPGFAGNLSAWKHPKRIVAMIHGSGFVDTRVSVSKKNCSTHFMTSGVLAPAQAGYSAYASLVPFYDSPPEVYGRCGVRYSPWATGEELDVPLLTPESNTDDFTFMLVFTSVLYSWRGNSEFQMLHILASGDNEKNAVLPGAKAYPTIQPVTQCSMDSSPLFIRNFVMREYIEDGVSQAILVNPMSKEKKNMVFIDYVLATRSFVSTTSFGAPDNRTVVDVAATDPLVKTGGPLNTLAVIYHDWAYVVTAELQDGPNWKAGSALWKVTFANKTWDLLAELPCCNQVWTSLMKNNMFGFAPTPSTTPPTKPSPATASTSSFNASASIGPSPSVNEFGFNPGDSASNGGAMAGGTIAGIVIGVVLALLCVCGGCVFFAMFRYRQLLQKRKEQLLELHKRDEEARLNREAEEERRAKEEEEKEEADGDSGDDDEDDDDFEEDGEDEKKGTAEEAKADAAGDEGGDPTAAAGPPPPPPKTPEEEAAERARAAEAAAKEVEKAEFEKLAAITDKNGFKVGQSAAAITEALLLEAESSATAGEEGAEEDDDDEEEPGSSGRHQRQQRQRQRPKSLVDAADELNYLLESLLPDGGGAENSPDSSMASGGEDEGSALEVLDVDVSAPAVDAQGGGGGGPLPLRAISTKIAAGASTEGGLRSVSSGSIRTTSYHLPGRLTATVTPRGSAGEVALKAVIKEMAPLLEPEALKLVLSTALRSAKLLAADAKDADADADGDGGAQGDGAAGATTSPTAAVTHSHGEEEDPANTHLEDGKATTMTIAMMPARKETSGDLVPLEVTISEGDDGEGSAAAVETSFVNPLSSSSGDGDGSNSSNSNNSNARTFKNVLRSGAVGASAGAGDKGAGTGTGTGTGAATVQTLRIGMSASKKGISTISSKNGTAGGGAQGELSRVLAAQKSASSMFTAVPPKQVLQSIVAAALKTATEFHDEFVAQTQRDLSAGPEDMQDDLLKPGRRQTHVEGGRLSVVPEGVGGDSENNRYSKPGMAKLLRAAQAGSGASGDSSDSTSLMSNPMRKSGRRRSTAAAAAALAATLAGGTGEAPDEAEAEGEHDEHDDDGDHDDGDDAAADEWEDEQEVEVEEEVEEDILDAQGRPTGQRKTVTKKIKRRIALKRRPPPPSRPAIASSSSVALAGPRKPAQSRPLSMALLHQNPDLFARLQARVEQAAMEAGKLAVLEGYRSRKSAVASALDKVKEEQEAARLAALSLASASSGRPKSGAYSTRSSGVSTASAASDQAGKEKRRKNREKAKKKRNGSSVSAKSSKEDDDDEGEDGQTGKKKAAGRKGSRLPDLAELERRYGSLSIPSKDGYGDSDGGREPLVPPPPGFVPFLGWFVRQQFRTLLSPFLGKNARQQQQNGRRGTARNRRFTDNDARVAAFAGLGLSKSDAGAFVLQNALLLAAASAGEGGGKDAAGMAKRPSLFKQGLLIGPDGTAIAPSRGGVRSAAAATGGGGLALSGSGANGAGEGGGGEGRIYVKPLADSRFKEEAAAAGGTARPGIASLALAGVGNIAAALASIAGPTTAGGGGENNNDGGSSGERDGSSMTTSKDGEVMISMSNPLRAPRGSLAASSSSTAAASAGGQQQQNPPRRSSVGGRRASGLLSSSSLAAGGGAGSGVAKRGSFLLSSPHSHTLPEALLRGVQAYHAGAPSAILNNNSGGSSGGSAAGAGSGGGGGRQHQRVRVVRGSMIDLTAAATASTASDDDEEDSREQSKARRATTRRSVSSAGLSNANNKGARGSVVASQQQQQQQQQQLPGRESLSTGILGVVDDDDNEDEENDGSHQQQRGEGNKGLRSSSKKEEGGKRQDGGVKTTTATTTTMTAALLDQDAVFKAADSTKLIKRGSRVAPTSFSPASGPAAVGVTSPLLVSGMAAPSAAPATASATAVTPAAAAGAEDAVVTPALAPTTSNPLNAMAIASSPSTAPMAIRTRSASSGLSSSGAATSSSTSSSVNVGVSGVRRPAAAAAAASALSASASSTTAADDGNDSSANANRSEEGEKEVTAGGSSNKTKGGAERMTLKFSDDSAAHRGNSSNDKASSSLSPSVSEETLEEEAQEETEAKAEEEKAPEPASQAPASQASAAAAAAGAISNAPAPPSPPAPPPPPKATSSSSSSSSSTLPPIMASISTPSPPVQPQPHPQQQFSHLYPASPPMAPLPPPLAASITASNAALPRPPLLAALGGFGSISTLGGGGGIGGVGGLPQPPPAPALGSRVMGSANANANANASSAGLPLQLPAPPLPPLPSRPQQSQSGPPGPPGPPGMIAPQPPAAGPVPVLARSLLPMPMPIPVPVPPAPGASSSSSSSSSSSGPGIGLPRPPMPMPMLMPAPGLGLGPGPGPGPAPVAGSSRFLLGPNLPMPALPPPRPPQAPAPAPASSSSSSSSSSS